MSGPLTGSPNVSSLWSSLLQKRIKK